MSNTIMARLVEIFEKNILGLVGNIFHTNSTIVDVEPVVSTINSTSTPLSADVVWTGEAELTKGYGILYVSIKTDKISAINGLKIEQGPDGVNWDHVDEYTINADSGENFSINAHSKYYRVSYTNGTSDQTYLRLTSILKPNGLASSHKIQDDIANEDDATLQIACLKTDKGDGKTFGSVDLQNPLSINNDSVYEQDIDRDNSTSENFIGGKVIDLFNDFSTTLINDTADNPKTIIIKLKRSITTTGLALGDMGGGTHSGIKIEAQRGGNTWTTIRDNSASIIPFNSRFYSFSTTVGNDDIGVIALTGLRITFNTTNTISVSNIIINKIQERQSTLLGLKPDGTTTYIGATRNSNLKVSVQEYGDTPSIDAFDRLRTSDPFTIFDSKQLHDKQPLFWDEEIGGSATSVHNPINAETKMSVTANANDYVIRQTKQRFNYQPGKSQLIFMTFHSPQAEGITNRVGIFDGIGVNYLTPNNGIFFECDGGLSWNIAKDGTIEENKPQSEWNVDRLDGTGKSGITLDMTSSQIAIIDFEWLGVGRVRVGFVINGLIYYCHYFNHSNDPAFPSVYMSTPNLPLRYSIETDGTNASHFDHICSSVISEGGIEKTGILRSVENADTGFVGNYTTGDKYALVGIKLKTAYKDITVMPESVQLVLGSSDSFKWELQINPIIDNTFTYTDLSDSAVQYAQGATNNTLVTDGLIISRGGGSTASRGDAADLETALRIGSTISGINDEMVLIFRPLTNQVTIWATLNFRELL